MKTYRFTTRINEDINTISYMNCKISIDRVSDKEFLIDGLYELKFSNDTDIELYKVDDINPNYNNRTYHE